MREMQAAWRDLLFSAAAVAFYRYWEVPFLSQGNQSRVNFPILTICLILFMLAFFRFLRGDKEYLAERYPPSENGANSSVSGLGRGFDVLALLLHGAIFTGLGLSVVQPDLFIRLYLLLLVVNASWLRLNRETTTMRVSLGGKEGIWMACSPGQDAARIWILNNFTTAGLLLAFELLWQSGRLSHFTWLGLGLGACFLNSVIDIKFAWSFYFPSHASK